MSIIYHIKRRITAPKLILLVFLLMLLTINIIYICQTGTMSTSKVANLIRFNVVFMGFQCLFLWLAIVIHNMIKESLV
jgi:hypothetical protein